MPRSIAIPQGIVDMIRSVTILLFAALASMVAAVQLSGLAGENDRLIVCGGSEVIMIKAEPGEVTKADWVWSWRATDSPQIRPEQAEWFRSTDECKPVGEEILITSSSGGVALIDRKTKACRFLTFAKNAHSACLLPNHRIAVAASFGGDELMIFRIDPKVVHQPDPVARSPLHGAHGALWDAERKRIWALGESELQLIHWQEVGETAEIVVEKSWKLPTAGGHDLSPTNDRSRLFITSNSAVYRFDKDSGAFTPDALLGEQAKVKSVDQHAATGAVVYHQGAGKNWWSDTLRFRGSGDVIRIPRRKLYKARWDRGTGGE